VHSINRFFFLSLGSVCFLIVPFFWLALAFDFSALENFVIALSHAEFVGYPIPELLGSAKQDTVVDKVSRIEIFFTIVVVIYSLFFIGLSYLEGARKRNRYCARGLAIPLFLLILGFWLKFNGDDHIISKEEKTELFQYTTGCFVISVMMFTYSFRSEKKVKPNLLPHTSETKKVVAEVQKDTESKEEQITEESDAESPAEEELDGEPDVALDPDPVSEGSAEESEVLPPPEPPATPSSELPPPPESPIAPATESVAASYQFPPETGDPSEERQEETDPSLQIVDEDADDPKPPSS